MYLISDTTKYELPLAVCNTLSELAQTLGRTIPNVCVVIRKQQIIRSFGIPARVYKIDDSEGD